MKKILLIEDEPVLVDLCKVKFSKEGFNVITALDSESGLQLARIEKPDLIILDILLPVRNGIAFLKKLRAEPEISKIPVFVFSCFDEVDIKKQAFDLGVEDYVLKTKCTLDQLVEKIKAYQSVTR
jgi:two-component system alkaline phosphatase synthesis response regulator PhoP